MRVLAIDTSSDIAALALVDGDVVRGAARHASARGRHAEALIGHLDDLFAAAAMAPRDVELVAVGLGPGSFTGVRTGVAVAKGLALARAPAIVGVHTTLALAVATGHRGVVATFVEASKGEVFVAAYALGAEAPPREALAPHHAAPRDAAARLASACADHAGTIALVGAALTRHGEEIADALGRAHVRVDPAHDAIDPVALAALGRARFAASGADDADTLEPLYARGSDAVLPTPRTE